MRHRSSGAREEDYARTRSWREDSIAFFFPLPIRIVRSVSLNIKHYTVVCITQLSVLHIFTDSCSQRRGLGLFSPCSLAPGTTPPLFINMF